MFTQQELIHEGSYTRAQENAFVRSLSMNSTLHVLPYLSEARAQ